MFIKTVLFSNLLTILIIYIEAGKIEECKNVIVSRNDWDAKTPVSIEHMIIPVEYAIIHHTVTPECTTSEACKSNVASIQSYHMDTLKWHDIGYNFLIGGDGKIYEGAGWHTIGAHTYGYNRRGLGIAFIGNFSDKLPSSESLNALRQLLQCAVATRELDERYKLMGFRQFFSSESPGKKLFDEIKTWSRWSLHP